MQKQLNLSFSCEKTHADSAYFAERWGGKYEYLCPLGLCFITCSIATYDEQPYAMITGPFLMVPLQEFVHEDLQNVFQGKHSQNLLASLKGIPFVTCNRVAYVADMIKLVAKNTSSVLYKKNQIQHEVTDAGKRMTELIYHHKGMEDALQLQLNLERQLINSIKLRDRENAQKLLNDILGSIYFNSYGDLKIIKARVTELVIGLLREAISAGVNIDHVFSLSGDYIGEIQKLESMRELDLWLSKALNAIMYSVFPSNNLRHSAVIARVCQYIDENYMKKITLNELAQLAGFSVSYLSKMFKEETQKSISAYMNMIRIENAKKLLLSTDMSLVELAYVVGFEEQSYFTKVFKKIEGVSPGKFRDTNISI